MDNRLKQSGFSLTEVLMAVGILSIGLMLVATMFPAALYLTTVASERTMAAIVADEAFAKIQLYGLSSYSADVNDYGDISTIDPNEFSYPPVDPCASNRQYYWSALCKKTDPNEYLVTVFVSRKTSPNHTYLGGGNGGGRPRAVILNVDVQSIGTNELNIPGGNERYVNPPTTVLDDATCKIYRVIDKKIDDPNVVLDRAWEDGTGTKNIWFVPPPQSGGKNADIEVFQRIIRF
jgi:prepilin-type N-terminal cleavage/methylation domain-containing protein